MQRDLQDTSNSAGGMDMDQYGMIREILEKSTYTVSHVRHRHDEGVRNAEYARP